MDRAEEASAAAAQSVYPLAGLAGALPPSPEWFRTALSDGPDRQLVTVEGADIELLTWGEIGKPGIMLLHGYGAHADWWDFIAPFLAKDYRVAAVSLSGAGNSDWRETYRFEQQATEVHVCAQVAGLYHAKDKPIYVGHSFGSTQVFYSAARYPDRMKAAVMIDAEFGSPPMPGAEVSKSTRAGRFNADGRTKPFPIYASLEEALMRFRFAPPQSPGLLCAADHIARTSLKRTPFPDGAGEGWTWKFDPGFWDRLDHVALRTVDPRNVPPISLIWGEFSPMTRGYLAGKLHDFLGSDLPSILIPDASHHIMVDQPLALTTALLALFAVWPPRP